MADDRTLDADSLRRRYRPEKVKDSHLKFLKPDGKFLFIDHKNEDIGKIKEKTVLSEILPQGSMDKTSSESIKREVFEKSALGISHGTPLGIYYETIIDERGVKNGKEIFRGQGSIIS